MSKFWKILVVLGVMLAVSGIAQAELQTGPGSAAGGSSNVIWSGLSLAAGQTGRIEIVGINTSSLTGNVKGGVRLRILQPGAAVADNISLVVQSRTYPDPAAPGGNNPLFQSCEWGGGDGAACTLWRTPSSHSHNVGEVIGPYDLALEVSQNANGTWHVNPLWRLPASSSLWHDWGTDPLNLPLDTWTTFGDGQWDTTKVFDLTSASLLLDVGDGFTGGMVTYDSISTTLVPEPATMLLLGFGVLGVLRAKKRN
jgi:hypothetical protein